MERESEDLRVLDEMQLSQRLIIVEAVSGWPLRPRAEEFSSFVISNCLDVDVTCLRELADRQCGDHGITL